MKKFHKLNSKRFSEKIDEKTLIFIFPLIYLKAFLFQKKGQNIVCKFFLFRKRNVEILSEIFPLSLNFQYPFLSFSLRTKLSKSSKTSRIGNSFSQLNFGFLYSHFSRCFQSHVVICERETTQFDFTHLCR